jgi:CRP/FNR family transcriptional regulator
LVDEEKYNELIKSYPVIIEAGKEFQEQFKQYAILKKIPAGEFIFIEKDNCTFFALILSGRVRVFKEGESGREVTLYRFEKGESCILTVSCILSDSLYPALAVAEEDSEAFLIPANVFREWVSRFGPWRKYVFEILAKRLSSVIMVVEEVAFRRVDSRIAELLLKETDKEQTVRLTHQQIAAEIGTSREVVSRILKDLEQEKMITSGRGIISIINVSELRKISKKSV